MRKLLGAAIVAVVLMGASPAQASTTLGWVPKAHYHCQYGAEWTLLPVKGITSATLTVDGHSYPMTVQYHWSYVVGHYIWSWWAESIGHTSAQTVATATFQGDPVDPSFDIAACVM